MKKILGIFLGVFWTISAYATEKFDILPDLPDPLVGAAAQASSVSTTADTAVSLSTQAATHEPNLISIVFSLIFVVLLIYATGIIYAKLNKLGLSTLKRQMGENNKSHVSVVSTTALGNNKTLHVVELDGKRMLIGASSSSIHLIKDLGSYQTGDIEEGEYSKIEIPNITIPKIEIPKIEIPNIGFTRAIKNTIKKKEEALQEMEAENSDQFAISDIYEEENPDGIIDKLFQTVTEECIQAEEQEELEHKVDPEEFSLYKKYLS